MPQIHPTAIVAPGAQLAEDVYVGPYSIIGEPRGSEAGVQPAVACRRSTGAPRIGAGTQDLPVRRDRPEPQDLKYRGEISSLVIGSDNTIREHATMNPGTAGRRQVTRVGDHCLFMVGVHIAHDCQIGDRVIMANNATLGGHVVIEDYAFLGGLSASTNMSASAGTR